MKPFIALTVLLIVMLTGAMAYIVAASPQKETPYLNINLYDDLTPGAKLPDHVICSLEGVQSRDDRIGCEVWRDDRMVSFLYNRRIQVIDYVSYLDLQDDLGHLLKIWGHPNGYIHQGIAWEFYWNDREAYVVPRYGLTIYSKVGVVTFGTPNQDYKPWP